MLKGALRTTETVVALAVGGVAGDTADEDDYQTDLSTDATLIIPAMAGSASLTFNLTLVEDLIDEGDQSFTLRAFNDLLGAAAATFVIADDDRAGVAVALTPQNLHGGEELPYTVVLESEPTADVEVAVAVKAVAGSEALPAYVTAMPASWTFTPANWHEPQTVILTVAPGLAVFGRLDIVHILTSADPIYQGLAPVSVGVEVNNRPLEFESAQTRRIKVFLEREPVTIPLAKLEPGSRVFVLEAPDDMVVKFDEDVGDYGAITLRRLAMDLDEDVTDEVKLVAIDAQGKRKVATIIVERPPLLPYIVPPNPRLIAAGEMRTWSLRLEQNTELDVIWDVTGGPDSVDYVIARTAGGHAELTLSASVSAQVGDEFELLLTAEVGAEDGGYRRAALLPVAVVAAKAKPHLKLSVTVPDAADPAKAVTVSSFALSESISVKAELEGAVPSLEDLGNVATLSFQIRVAKLDSGGVPSGEPLIFMAESRVEDGATALDIAPVLVGNLMTSTLDLAAGSVVEVSIGHLPWTDSTEVSDEISDELIAGASLRLLVSKAAGRRDADNDGLADGGESEPGALDQILAAVAEVPDGVVALQRNTASLSLGNVARSLGLGQCGALSLTLTLMLSSDGVPSAVLTGCGGAPVDSSQLSTEISAALDQPQFRVGEDYQLFDLLATFDSSGAGAGGEPLVVVIDLPVDPGTYNVYRYDEGRNEWVPVAVLSGQPGLEGPGALVGIDGCRSCFYVLDFDRDGSVELLLLLDLVDPAEAEASFDYVHPDPDFRRGWIYVDVEETLTIELLNLGDGWRVEVTGEAIDLGYVRGRYVETAEGPVVELRALKRTGNGPEEVLIEAFNESGEAVATITLYVSVRNQAPEIEFRLLSGEPTTSIALPPNTEMELVVMILDPDGDTDFELELTGGGDLARLELGANPTVEVDSVSGGSVVINRLILTSKGARPPFNLTLEATDSIDKSKSSGRLTVCVNDTGKCPAAAGGGGGTGSGSGSGGGGSLGPWVLAALVLPLLLGWWRRRRLIGGSAGVGNEKRSSKPDPILAQS